MKSLGRPMFSCPKCQPGAMADWSAEDEAAEATLARIRVSVSFDEGEALFRQGDDSLGLYCLSAGVVGLRMVDAEGAGAMVDLAFPGDLIGVRAFLREAPHRTTAEALGPVRACRISRADAERVSRQHPRLSRLLVGACLDTLDRAQEQMLENAALSNHDRLMRLLCRLILKCGRRTPNGTLAARLPLSREDIATMIGVRHETLSRLFGKLRDGGLLRVSGRNVELIGDPETVLGPYAEMDADWLADGGCAGGCAVCAE